MPVTKQMPSENATVDQKQVQLFETLLENETSTETQTGSKPSEEGETVTEDTSEQEEFLHNLMGAFWRMPMVEEKMPEAQPTITNPTIENSTENQLSQVFPLEGNKATAGEAQESGQTVLGKENQPQNGDVEASNSQPTGEAKATVATPETEQIALTKEIQEAAAADQEKVSAKIASMMQSAKGEPASEEGFAPVKNAEKNVVSGQPGLVQSETDTTYQTTQVDTVVSVEETTMEKPEAATEPINKPLTTEVKDVIHPQIPRIETDSRTSSTSTTVAEVKQVPKEQLASVLGDIVVEHVHSPEKPDQTTTRILLTPERLGEVEVKLDMQNNRLTASITVEHAETKQWLEQQLVHLTNKLADQSIQVQQFQVTVSQLSEQAASFSGQFQQERRMNDGEKKKQSNTYNEGSQEAEEPSENQPAGRLSLLA